MFNLDNYETVDERIHKFWETYPNGRLHTELVEIVRGSNGEPLQYVIKAYAYRNMDDAQPFATGYAEEIVGSSNINTKAALENAETSALGRCLSNGSFSAKGNRPSQTEMQKVQNVQPNARVQDFTEIPLPPSKREVKAPQAEWKSEPVKGTDTVIKEPNAAPSEKQTAALVNKTSKTGITSDFYNQFWQFALAGGQMNGTAEITKGEASKLIGMDKEDFEGLAASFYASLLSNDESAPF